MKESLFHLQNTNAVQVNSQINSINNCAHIGCNNKLDPTDEYFNPQVSNKETNTIFSSDKPEACFNEYDDYAKINDWEFGNRKKWFTITEVESDDSIKEIV